MPGDASAATTSSDQAAHSLRIIVPRDHDELCRSLERTFGADAKVQVIVDRRLGDRRVRADAHNPERRHGDRRHRSDMESELKAGRWVALPRAGGQIDFVDPDARAILFLCCSEHVVPCQKCQNTYRIRSISRDATGVFSCPLCGHDLTPPVVAHVQTCRYWTHRGPAKMVRMPPSAAGADAAG